MALPHNWTADDILALSLAKIKSTVVRRVVEQYPSLANAIAASPEELAEHGIADNSLFLEDTLAALHSAVQQQRALCEHHAVHIATLWDDDYPTLLRAIAHPPTVLYVRGTLQPPQALAISIVGTRKCTAYGKLTTERFVEAFAQHNIAVVSGLAFGIDTAAHKAALAAHTPTYAVIASGIDAISPHLSAVLARDISTHSGAVISEYPCGTKALPAYFPQRNRIISGIAQATLVVESRERGGALITAQFAREQQRAVFAIPGAITSEQSRGTNILLQREHAQMALSPSDVLRALALPAIPNKSAIQEALFLHLTDEERQVYAHIGFEPVHLDTIAERSGKPVHELLPILLALEFSGVLKQLPGRQFVRMG